MEEKQKISFPESNNFTNEYLLQNFWKLHYDNAGENLKYFAILPKDVRPIDVKPMPVNGTNLTNIGIYKRIKESGNPYLEVYCYTEHLTKGIQPVQWVKNNLQKVGHEIVHQKLYTTDNGIQYIDVLTKSSKSSTIARTTELINGKGDYVMLSVFCAEKDYEALAPIMLFIVHSWRLE